MEIIDPGHGTKECNEIYQHTTLNNNLRFKLYIQEQL